MTADLAIILALVLAAISVAVWIYKSGGDKFKVKILEREVKDHKEFDKRGEEWDGMGGLGGIVKRRVRKRSWKL